MKAMASAVLAGIAVIIIIIAAAAYYGNMTGFFALGDGREDVSAGAGQAGASAGSGDAGPVTGTPVITGTQSVYVDETPELPPDIGNDTGTAGPGTTPTVRTGGGSSGGVGGV